MFAFALLRVPCILWTEVLNVCFSNIFIPLYGLSFNYINSVFHIAQVFNFNKYIFPFSFFFNSGLLVELKHIAKHNVMYRWRKKNYSGFFIRHHESEKKMEWNNENVLKKYWWTTIVIYSGDFSLALKEK